MNFDDFDIWWRQRGDSQQLQEMQNALRDALKNLHSRQIEYSIRWRLARLHHFQAMVFEENGKRKTAHHQFVLARYEARCAAFLSDDVAGHFWLGVCLLEAARSQNKLAALLALGHARRSLQLALERDETFHFAGAWRVLGRMSHKTPGFLGGEKQRSFNFYQHALEIAPGNSTTQLYCAELLLSMKRKSDAAKTLQQIVAQPVDENWKWEQARDRERARFLLQKEESEKTERIEAN